VVGFLLDKLARGFHGFAFVDAVLQPVEDECRRIYTRTISLKSPGRIRGDTGCRRGEGNKNPAREIVPHQRNPCRLGSVQNRLLGFVAANGGICHINRFNRAVVEDAKKTQASSTTRRPGRRVGLGLGWFEQIDFPQSAHWATTDLAARGGVGSSAASVFDLGAGASQAAPRMRDRSCSSLVLLFGSPTKSQKKQRLVSCDRVDALTSRMSLACRELSIRCPRESRLLRRRSFPLKLRRQISPHTARCR
jgi:hypothetical protein